jgi:hypothetical protein
VRNFFFDFILAKKPKKKSKKEKGVVFILAGSFLETNGGARPPSTQR